MNNDQLFVEMAIEQAKLSVEQKGFPAGAVIVLNGEVISKGVSTGYAQNDPTAHSETASIREACRILKTSNLEQAVLYSSLQPCLMCFSVGYWAGIRKIVFAAKKNSEMVSKQYYEGSTDTSDINDNNSNKIELVHFQSLEEASLQVVHEWELRGGFNQ